MRNFIRTIVGCSEKAANIARACRKEKDLFQLLVEVVLICVTLVLCSIFATFWRISALLLYCVTYQLLCALC